MLSSLPLNKPMRIGPISAALILVLAALGTARGETKACPELKQPSTAPWQGTKLISAIFESNARSAAALMEKGVDLNQSDSLGNTPLVLALTPRESLEPVGVVSKMNRQTSIKREDDARKKIVPLLLAKGANPNSSGTLGRTALMQVAALGRDKVWNLQIASKLIDKGARINAQDDYGNTPLILASDIGAVGLIDLFLKHGADPNIRNCRNESALSLASSKHLSVAQKHLEAAMQSSRP